MRLFGRGLVAALLMAIAVPAAVSAAAPTKAPAVTKEAHEKGMKDAPDLVSAGALNCQPSNARYIGHGSDPKTKVTQDVYEIACVNAEGYIVAKKSDGFTAVTCLNANQPMADGKPNPTSCILPENSDPKAGMLPYFQKADVKCDVTQVRGLGQTTTNAFFEVACANHPGGFVIETSAPLDPAKPVIGHPCMTIPDNLPIHCTLTDRQAQLAVVDALAKASGKPCVIKDGGRGFIGESTSGKFYWEAACEDGKGYMLVEAVNGGLDTSVPCVQAEGLLGGCRLTNSRAALDSQNGLYTQLAKKAGFNCDVSGYAPLPSLQSRAQDDTVELKCGNRPDGGIGFFPPDNSAGFVYDCAHVEVFTYQCKLNKPAESFKALTEDLNKVGRKECVVSEARGIGANIAEKKGFLEVGCADGLQGYVIEYTVNPPAAMAPQSAIVCSQAGGINGGCRLPGNTKKS